VKKLYTLIIIAAFLLSAFIDYSNSSLTANSGGAPLGHTGSPFDGRACNACHAGPAASNQPGWIISNIPAAGYVPGETYTITATATRTGINRFGFQVAAKTSTGTQAGTLKSISSETNVQSGGRSITHTSFGNSATDNSKTWVFEWTAPVAPAGNVTFFGAFLAADGNGSSSGDVTLTSNLVVQQRTSTSIISNGFSGNDLIVALYPNPVTDVFNITISSKTQETLDIFLLDIQGRDMGNVFRGDIIQGENTLAIRIPEGLPAGMYTVVAKTSNNVSTQRIKVN
jgi:hypothetical protein